MKKLFLSTLFALSMVAFVSCGDDTKSTTENDVTPDNSLTEQDIVPDEETAPVACKLEDTFIEPIADYSSYLAVRLIGPIADATDENAPQILEKTGTLKAKGTSIDPFKQVGIFMADAESASTIALGYGDIKQGSPDANGMVRIGAKITQAIIPNATLTAMKESNTFTKEEAPVIVVFDVLFDINSKTNAQALRKQCFYAVGDLVSNTSGTGKMKVCHEKNTTFAIGETLKLAINAKLVDQDADIQTLIGAETKICTCYNEKGQSTGTNDPNEIDCADLDKPVDPCTPNPCKDTNKTVCTATDGKAVCSCDEGYVADGANCVAKPVVDYSCSEKGKEKACTTDADCTGCTNARCVPEQSPVMKNTCIITKCDSTKPETCPTGKTCMNNPQAEPLFGTPFVCI